MKRLIVVVGPTAAGKTAEAVRLASCLDTEIVSCDSRQFYRELNIGVARPSDEELAAVRHHFIACRSLLEPYNVFDFEHDALRLLQSLFSRHDDVVAVGGSGLYIDALCNGISVLPTPSAELRAELQRQLREEGIVALQRQLEELDPVYFSRVDRDNPVRLQRALEVCLTAGKPYSSLLSERAPQPRPFQIVYRMVTHAPEVLRERINRRVDQMLTDGLEQEAMSLQPLWEQSHPQTLNTVGYKEFYEPLPPSENPSAPHTIPDWIKLNTWHYAKKQLTWFKKALHNQVSSNSEF